MKREITDFQISLRSVSINNTSEFNEVCLETLHRNEDCEKKFNSTFGSTASKASTQKKDIENAFLIPHFRRKSQ